MAKQGEIPTKFSEGWIDSLDRRTSIAKAVNERMTMLTSDLGGMDMLSYQQRSLCKRAIWLEALIEQQEADLAKGKEVDQGRLTQAINTFMGLLKTLGLERKSKDVTLSDLINGASQ